MDAAENSSQQDNKVPANSSEKNPLLSNQAKSKLFKSKKLLFILLIALLMVIIPTTILVLSSTQNPKARLQNLLNKQAKEYKINYEVTYEASDSNHPKSKDVKTFEIFYSKSKLKVKRQFSSTDSRTPLTDFYFELPNGNTTCFQPSITGTLLPLVCQPQNIEKDPLSTDGNVIPAERINLIKDYLNEKNYKYIGEKEIINRKCDQFDTDIKDLDSKVSPSLKYLREVYKTQPGIFRLNFCLDKESGIPLEMSAEQSYSTSFYGNSNTKLSFVATSLDFNINEKDFELPKETNVPSPVSLPSPTNILPQIGCIKSPAFNEDKCNGYRNIKNLEYGTECLALDDCLKIEGDATCVKGPLIGDACTGYRVIRGISRSCYTLDECRNISDPTAPSIVPPYNPAKKTFGNVIKLDGKTGYIKIFKSPTLKMKNNFTIEMWIKLGEPEDSRTLTNILSENQNEGFSASTFMLFDKNISFNPLLEPNTGQGFTGGPQTKSPIIYNKWYHIAGTISESKPTIIELFINGKSQGRRAMREPIEGRAGDLAIGAWLQDNLPAGPNLNAEIGEVRISDIVRYQGDFTTPKFSFEPDKHTLGLWNFNKDIKDSSGNGNHAILMGTAKIVPAE